MEDESKRDEKRRRREGEDCSAGRAKGSHANDGEEGEKRIIAKVEERIKQEDTELESVEQGRSEHNPSGLQQDAGATNAASFLPLDDALDNGVDGPREPAMLPPGDVEEALSKLRDHRENDDNQAEIGDTEPVSKHNRDNPLLIVLGLIATAIVVYHLRCFLSARSTSASLAQAGQNYMAHLTGIQRDFQTMPESVAASLPLSFVVALSTWTAESRAAALWLALHPTDFTGGRQVDHDLVAQIGGDVIQTVHSWLHFQTCVQDHAGEGRDLRGEQAEVGRLLARSSHRRCRETFSLDLLQIGDSLDTSSGERRAGGCQPRPRPHNPVLEALLEQRVQSLESAIEEIVLGDLR